MLPVLLDRHTAEAQRDGDAASKDLRALLALSQEERLARIRRATSRFRSLALAGLLLSEARSSIPADPQRVYELAEVAEAVLLRTPQAPGYFDALTRASAYRANALRATGKITEADERFLRTRRLIRSEEVTDLLVYAEVDWLEGVLRKDQRRFGGAEGLLIRSASLFQLAGERIEAARPLLALGLLYGERQELAKAIETTDTALRGIRPEIDPRLYCYARHNLILFLCDAGRFREAEAPLEEHRELYQDCLDPYTQARLVWIEGKIALGLGRWDQAERLFIAVRQNFIDQANGYDTAMVSLDLALVYLKAGRITELKSLADEMHGVFASEGIHREALVALRLFEEAAREERITVELLEDLALYLKRARRNPALRFEKEA
jgi:tetratricopeptide (TPR) repeat protein